VNIPVVYDDDWLCIVNKPSGLLVIPTIKNEQRTLTSILNDDLKSKKVSYRLHPCHRLDKETSGLIIYAKGKSTQKKMMDEFKQREVKKTYIAFVQGKLLQNQGRITRPIEGSSAITKYKVLETKKNFSIVEIQPFTGRTNQIRIHFSFINHPIVGETKYAFRRDFALRGKRLCLHAKSLEFVHPITKRMISLNIELPTDLREFIKNH